MPLPHSRIKKIRHGQALSMQWVAFLLQVAETDLSNPNSAIKDLLKGIPALTYKQDFDALKKGCDYVVSFVLPLALELSLKSLILKENATPKLTHNLVTLFNQLQNNTKNHLNKRYCEASNIHLTTSKTAFKDLLKEHKDDFEGWRYLDEAEKLKKEDIKLQYAITIVLDVYHDPTHVHKLTQPKSV